MEIIENQFLKCPGAEGVDRYDIEMEMHNLEEIFETLAGHSIRRLDEMASHLHLILSSDTKRWPDHAARDLDLLYVVTDLFALLRIHTDLLHEKAERAKAITSKF